MVQRTRIIVAAILQTKATSVKYSFSFNHFNNLQKSHIVIAIGKEEATSPTFGRMQQTASGEGLQYFGGESNRCLDVMGHIGHPRTLVFPILQLYRYHSPYGIFRTH